MKVLVVVASLIALSAAGAVPLVPGDNSDYVEGVSRYIWMPDGDDVPHLVDLEEPVDFSAFNSRNGANNHYWLFTRYNRNNHQILVNGDINSVRNSNYRANRPTKVIVHGWNSNGNSGVNTYARDAFLAVQDCNVIVVDWRSLANSGYNTAVNGVPNVGQFLGNFLVWLFNNAGGNWNDLHLVGFSLGAHVVGNAGRQAGGRPRRVTGLDPAGPRWGGNAQALNTQAGRYVEAIHTDGGTLGIMDRIAHVDYYPNGGRNPQPGCWISTCSHSRAYRFFAASVRYNRFAGRQCSNMNQVSNNQCAGSTLHMGNGIISKSGNGIFRVNTGANWPF
ncbi:hypothetical protein ABMA27_006920 [Loxostege sticticalis]|uniref:Lipase domain-containing protein n=1 Tax=Loxostege sticticalis TaxID=481309 RepID=A0ABR3IKX7_LOXSC